jgi:hypothetical protein
MEKTAVQDIMLPPLNMRLFTSRNTASAFNISSRAFSTTSEPEERYMDKSAFRRYSAYSEKEGDERSLKKTTVKSKAPTQEPAMSRAETDRPDKNGVGTFIQVKIPTMPAKYKRFQIVSASGIPCDITVPIVRTTSPITARIQAAHAVLQLYLKAVKPRGTRKKKAKTLLRIRKRQIPAAASATIKALRPGISSDSGESVRHKREKGYYPCPLDGQSQSPLVLGAGSGDAPRQDLSPFGNKPAQGIRILIVNL